MDAERRIWLDSLKAGSEVLLIGRKSRIARVDRLTDTQIVINNAMRFRRKDGEEVGSQSFSQTVMAPVLQEHRDHAEVERLRASLISFLQSRPIRASDLPMMKRMEAAIKAPADPIHPRQRF